jgi:hypothetical protein
MNSNREQEQELAARIDRELKSLPPLIAPPSLAPRIIARLAAQAEVAWYRRAWPTWPEALRVGSLTVLLVLFGGLCFAGWQASHAPSVTAASEKVSGAFALVTLAANTLGALGNAAAQVMRHLGTGAIVAAIAIMALAYAACVAFGSFYLRFAFARR